MPVNVSRWDGATALYSATVFEQTDVIKHLLHEGANVNIQTELLKETPLHKAARQNNDEAARILLDNGADANLTNDVNETPLDVADKGGAVERLLLQLQQSVPSGKQLEVIVLVFFC